MLQQQHSTAQQHGPAHTHSIGLSAGHDIETVSVDFALLSDGKQTQIRSNNTDLPEPCQHPGSNKRAVLWHHRLLSIWPTYQSTSSWLSTTGGCAGSRTQRTPTASLLSGSPLQSSQSCSSILLLWQPLEVQMALMSAAIRSWYVLRAHLQSAVLCQSSQRPASPAKHTTAIFITVLPLSARLWPAGSAG